MQTCHCNLYAVMVRIKLFPCCILFSCWCCLQKSFCCSSGGLTAERGTRQKLAFLKVAGAVQLLTPSSIALHVLAGTCDPAGEVRCTVTFWTASLLALWIAAAAEAATFNWQTNHRLRECYPATVPGSNLCLPKLKTQLGSCFAKTEASCFFLITAVQPHWDPACR